MGHHGDRIRLVERTQERTVTRPISLPNPTPDISPRTPIAPTERAQAASGGCVTAAGLE